MNELAEAKERLQDIKKHAEENENELEEAEKTSFSIGNKGRMGATMTPAEFQDKVAGIMAQRYSTAEGTSTVEKRPGS